MDSTYSGVALFKGDTTQLLSSGSNPERRENRGAATAVNLQTEIPVPMDEDSLDAPVTDRNARIAHNPKKMMVEYIEGMPVRVSPSVGCSVCLTAHEGGLDDLTSMAFAPDNENCVSNWHSFCKECLDSVRSKGPAVCPLCRGSFSNSVPLQGWDKQLSYKKQVYFQPEFLTCPGCHEDMLRADIREHVVNCEKNKMTLEQNEAEYRASYLDYLKQHRADAGLLLSRNSDDRPTVVLYECDDQGQFQRYTNPDFMVTHPEVGKPLHNTSVGSVHQLFLNSPGDELPVAGVVQFESVTGEHESSQLKELPSVTSNLRPSNHSDLAALRSIPVNYQRLLSKNLADPDTAAKYLETSFTHAFTALQHTNAPVALSFQAGKVAVEGFGPFANNFEQVKSAFLLYGIKIPGSDAYWGIQKVEPDKRIVLEASKHYQLIGLDTMTRQEEADIEKVTGQSVRENRNNSIRYTLILTTLMETKPDQSTSYLPGQSAGGFGAGQHAGLFGVGQSAGGFGAGQRAGGFVGVFGAGQHAGLFGAGQRAGGFGAGQRAGEFAGVFGAGQHAGVFAAGQRTGGFGAEVESDDVVGFNPFGEVNESDSRPLARLASSSSTDGPRLSSNTFSYPNAVGVEFGARDPNARNISCRLRPSTGSPRNPTRSSSGFGSRDGLWAVESSGGHFSARPFGASSNVQGGGLHGTRSLGSAIQPAGSLFGAGAVPFSAGVSSGTYDLTGRVGGGGVFGELTSGGNAYLRPRGGHHEPEIVEKGCIKDEQPVTSVPENDEHLENLPPELKRALAFGSDATVKSLSDQVVPEAYQKNKVSVEAVGNLCPKSLVPRLILSLYVDAVCTPCPVSSKEPPVGLLLEAAKQQMYILES